MFNLIVSLCLWMLLTVSLVLLRLLRPLTPLELANLDFSVRVCLFRQLPVWILLLHDDLESKDRNDQF